MYNRKMKGGFTTIFIVLIISVSAFAQKEKYEIYSSYFTKACQDRDCNLIVVKGMNKDQVWNDLVLDEFVIERLERYLTDTTGGPEEGVVFRHLNAVPYIGLGQFLLEDTTRINMILQLDSLIEKDFRLKRRVKPEGILTRTIKRKAKVRNMPLRLFCNLSHKFWGIVSISDVVYSPDGEQATFLSTYYKNSLHGGGSLIYMVKVNGQWQLNKSFRLYSI